MSAADKLRQAIAIADEKAETGGRWYTRCVQLRALVALIPGLGGSIDAALSTVGGNANEAQTRIWMDQVAAELGRQSERIIVVEGRPDNEAFLSSEAGQQLLAAAVQENERWRSAVAYPGAAPLDAQILAACCSILVQTGQSLIMVEALRTLPEISGIADEDLAMSLHMLERYGLITEATPRLPEFGWFKLTPEGFNHYAAVAMPGYRELRGRVVRAILAHRADIGVRPFGSLTSATIADELGDTEVRVRMVLFWLRQQDYIGMGTPLGPVEEWVTRVDPALARIAASL